MAVDLPGHGSCPLAGLTDLGAVADRVLEEVEGPVDLVGVSLGGAVAQHAALRHPDRVRSAVLACTSPATRTDILLARAEALERDGLEAALDETLRRWFSRAVLAKGDHPAVAYTRRRLLSDDVGSLAANWRMLAKHDLREELPGLALPVTVIAAAEDAGTPRSATDELHRLVPGSVQEILPGPHMVHMENGTAFAAAVRRHLDRVEAR